MRYCHVSNFGGFGSPERKLVLDINDFDETLHAPWEWDVKRPATSIVLAGRQVGIRERYCSDAVRVAVGSYREHMREYAKMRALEVWYSELYAEILIAKAKTATVKKYWERVEDKAKLQTAEHIFPSPSLRNIARQTAVLLKSGVKLAIVMQIRPKNEHLPR